MPVLGFTALQLSPDRDPNAPHAERRGSADLDLQDLVDLGLVRGLAPVLLVSPPRIPARTPTERAALGYLYGNCAMCHNGRGPGAVVTYLEAEGHVRASVELDHRLHVDRIVAGPELRTEVVRAEEGDLGTPGLQSRRLPGGVSPCDQPPRSSSPVPPHDESPACP